MTSYRRMLLVLGCMIATAVILQGAFDASDHAKAERIVRNYRGATGPSVGERVERTAPGGAWVSEITHGCRGYVRVSYVAPTGTWIFDYDVPEHRIHPGNPAAEEVLAAIPPPPAAPR